jgi:hypothetical protein
VQNGTDYSLPPSSQWLFDHCGAFGNREMRPEMTAMNSTADVFSEDLRRFINDEQWRVANRMPDWPHEYLVRERVDRKLFERAVKHIRSNGYEGRVYQTEIRYYEEGDLVYWTMGAPVEETVIINRCRKAESLQLRVRQQGEK